ncbi:helix-turn-helix domain-containing protein [Streptomyces sp. NPDC058953]|uniref:helix-turn-helix domain-containing protein n=1 Tax=unclassified Streptomyces TaxID=2593676 RepID=UPI0036CDF0B6
MVRLTRAQQQERTRAAVLAAARAEFAEHGYAGAKVDRVAERAELTRGAVYSNFPGKRALYLAVLIGQLDGSDTGAEADGGGGEGGGGDGPPAVSPAGVAEALGAFARARLGRLPLSDGRPDAGHALRGSMAGVLDDERSREVWARLTRMEALLLGLTLESRAPSPSGGPKERQVRRAELALRLLNGAAGADGPAGDHGDHGDPFDTALACAHLAGLGLHDSWRPPHLPHITPARPVREVWRPPAGAADLLTGRPVDLARDGVVAVLGTERLGAAEEAVRVAGPGESVTLAVVTDDPEGIGRLVRLRIGELAHGLRRVFAPGDLPGVRIVLDEGAGLSSAAGVPEADDGTEAAVRVRGAEVVARARGRGAALALAAVGGAEGTDGGPGAGFREGAR